MQGFSLKSLMQELNRRAQYGGACDCPDCYRDRYALQQQLQQEIHKESVTVAKQNCYEPTRRLPPEEPQIHRGFNPGKPGTVLAVGNLAAGNSSPVQCWACGMPLPGAMRGVPAFCQPCYMRATGRSTGLGG